jgi:glutathione S-transferase
MYNSNTGNDQGRVMLKLFYASVSPYARKVRVLIAEKGIENRITLQSCLPFEKPAELIALNPLSKVPCLVLEDGTALYDSPFICEYLDQMSAPELLPPGGPARWLTLGRQALADGILDAGSSNRLEGQRPETERSPGWIARQTEVMDRTLNSFEAAIAGFGERITMAHIALGCTLGWLDFRLPNHDWRKQRPQLSDWFGQISARPSMIATKPA